MRKLKELWQLVKGIFKDRTPYIVVYEDGSKTVLAFVDAELDGGTACGVFVGDWDGAHRFMKRIVRRGFPRHNLRIAVAGDVPGLSKHPFLSTYY